MKNIISFLFLLNVMSFSGLTLATDAPAGSPEWCAINKVCEIPDDPATGPDEGKGEFLRASGKASNCKTWRDCPVM